MKIELTVSMRVESSGDLMVAGYITGESVALSNPDEISIWTKAMGEILTKRISMIQKGGSK